MTHNQTGAINNPVIVDQHQQPEADDKLITANEDVAHDLQELIKDS